MGVFIISPTDKGGMLWKPPKTFAEVTAPLSPIAFNNLWLLSNPAIHTLSVGAEVCRRSSPLAYVFTFRSQSPRISRDANLNQLSPKTRSPRLGTAETDRP